MPKNLQFVLTAVDKTAAGVKSANRNFGGMAKFAEKIGGDSRIGQIAKRFGGLSKSAGEAGGMLEGAAMGMGEAGAAAGPVGLIVAAVAVALTAAASAAMEMSNKFTAAGASLERTSEATGVTVADLQRLGGAARYSGVSTDDMTASVAGLGQALNDSRFGRNPMVAAVLQAMGVSVQFNKNGPNTKKALLDIANALSKMNPQSQAYYAGILGVSRALPALRHGAAAFVADMQRYDKTGAAIDDAAARRSVEYQQRLTEMSQKWAAVKRQVSEALLPVGSWLLDMASGAIGGVRDFFSWMGRVPGWLMNAWKPLGTFFADLWAKITGGAAADLPKKAEQAKDAALQKASQLANQAGQKAAELSSAGAKKAAQLAQQATATGRSVLQGAQAFFSQIEHQESRGRQFDRRGQPLTSRAGAVGVMQLLPGTAALVAKRLGVAWDVNRFKTDASYNRMLGQGELSRLLRKYGGDMTLAAAAYNAGEGWLDGFTDRKGRRHAGWLTEFGDPRKGKLTDAQFAAKIPFAETRNYVGAFAEQQRLDVNIQLQGAPAGTRVSSRATPGVDHRVRVDTAMPSGAPAV